MYDDRTLGSHYFLWEDHGKYTLLYNKEENYSSSLGIAVLDKWVVNYTYNESYIAIKTVDYTKEAIALNEFWLINKNMKVDVTKNNWKEAILIGPLDSLQLEKKLQQGKTGLSTAKWKVLD
jgi:hypothetical protein